MEWGRGKGLGIWRRVKEVLMRRRGNKKGEGRSGYGEGRRVK